MTNDLTPYAREGHAAAQAGAFPADCPHIATSSTWAAWLYGWGLGANNGPVDGIAKVTQSRGYTLRVKTRGGMTYVVPFPSL